MELLQALGESFFCLLQRLLKAADADHLLLSQGIELRYQCLEKIRWPEASHPQEAALSGGRPHPGDEMEDICPGRGTLEAEEVIVVGQGIVDDGPEVTVWQLRVQASPELNHAPAVIVQPPVVLCIEHRSACAGVSNWSSSNQETLGTSPLEILLQLSKLQFATLKLLNVGLLSQPAFPRSLSVLCQSPRRLPTSKGDRRITR